MFESTTSDEILVVDDNRANRTAIRAALEGLDARVVMASSGAEALRHMLDRDFALLLLDVQMPTMNGFETARLLRARERSRHTPIIFVTAHERNDADVLHAYKLGAVDFLFKPIVGEVLRAKASVFLELHRRTTEVARQAQRLQELARREHELELANARRRWEEESLRRQMQLERHAAAEAARRAEELARTVAELERADGELVRMNRELAESDRRKDEFLAVLAHELRNPLAPIVNSLELLKLLLGENPDPNLKRAVRAIQRQTHHLTRLVDDLLDLSRINSGKIELCTERLLVTDVVSQAVALSQSWIDERGHELRVDIVDPDLELMGDSVRLSQVLANLLNNAARYTDPGGLLELTCRRHDGKARVSVRDNGRGVPPDLLDKVFDMFVQENTGGGGLGIGLSLVRSLVELHGGSVTAESSGGRHGSTFTIDLPLLEAGDGRRPSTPLPTSRLLTTPLRIAVVDDNADVRETLRDLLESWGHTVLLAADGAAAIRLICEESPDVALIDLGLPIHDGYQVARQIRAQAANRTRLVAVSGYGRDRDRQRALEAGFDLHLVKPAAAETLLRALALSVQERAGPPNVD